MPVKSYGKKRQLDFICVGFAKSGTTTLYDILKQHPDVFLSGIKEPVFWNDCKARQKGENWYLNRYYREAGINQLLGEINPQITNNMSNIETVKKILKKDGKIIFIMRNPIERLYSHFCMDLIWGNYCKNSQSPEYENYAKMFEMFVQQTINRGSRHPKDRRTIIQHSDEFIFGDYVDHLKNYMEVFDRKNILILIFEEFVCDIKAHCAELFEFLGIRKDIDINYEIKSNEGSVMPRNNMCMRINGIWYREIWPWICRNININRETDFFFDQNLNWNLRKKGVLLKLMNRKEMTQRARHNLNEIYIPEIKDMEKILGRSLKNIWYEE